MAEFAVESEGLADPGASRKARRVATSYTVLLMPILILDGIALSGHVPDWYLPALIVLVVSFVATMASDRKLRAGQRPGTRLVSEPVRRLFARRGPALAFFSALLIGVTGAPNFGPWFEGITNGVGPWGIAVLSILLAGFSAYDALGAIPLGGYKPANLRKARRLAVMSMRLRDETVGLENQVSCLQNALTDERTTAERLRRDKEALEARLTELGRR